MSADELLTFREMGKKHFPEIPLHRLQYALDQMPHIQPRRRAGSVRLFAADQVADFRAAVAKLQPSRGWREKFVGASK